MTFGKTFFTPCGIISSHIICRLYAATEGVGEVAWLPDGELPSHFTKLTTESETNFSYVSYYHDNDLVHTLQQNVLSSKLSSEKANLQQEQLIDTINVSMPTLDLTSTAEQWAAVSDIINNILFVVDSAEQESIDRLETLKYKAQLRQQSELSGVKPVKDLQAAVR